MKALRRWPLSLTVLGAAYVLVLAADLLAPYEPSQQNRSLPLAPPTWPRFVDSDGRFHLRPFVYGLRADPERPGRYVEDRTAAWPVFFFVRPAGSDPARSGLRLFGLADGAGGHIFLLGTDRLGRDVFSRLLYGGRISLSAGILAGLISVLLGFLAGGMAGYWGHGVDMAVMRLGELFLALPWLYLLLAARAFLPLTLPTGWVVAVIAGLIGILGWVQPAWLVRDVVRVSRRRDSVISARGFGAPDGYLLWYHVLPPTWGVLLVQLAILIPRFVLAEVSLSFLGLGIHEPVPSWGNMLVALRQYHLLSSAWWLSSPAIALVAVVLSYHHLARALQERLGVARKSGAA